MVPENTNFKVTFVTGDRALEFFQLPFHQLVDLKKRNTFRISLKFKAAVGTSQRREIIVPDQDV